MKQHPLVTPLLVVIAVGVWVNAMIDCRPVPAHAQASPLIVDVRYINGIPIRAIDGRIPVIKVLGTIDVNIDRVGNRDVSDAVPTVTIR